MFLLDITFSFLFGSVFYFLLILIGLSAVAFSFWLTFLLIFDYVIMSIGNHKDLLNYLVSFGYF